MLARTKVRPYTASERQSLLHGASCFACWCITPDHTRLAGASGLSQRRHDERSSLGTRAPTSTRARTSRVARSRNIPGEYRGTNCPRSAVDSTGTDAFLNRASSRSGTRLQSSLRQRLERSACVSRERRARADWVRSVAWGHCARRHFGKDAGAIPGFTKSGASGCAEGLPALFRRRLCAARNCRGDSLLFDQFALIQRAVLTRRMAGRKTA